MGADDEGGDSSGNSGSHPRDAPTWAPLPARRVVARAPEFYEQPPLSSTRKPHAAADRDSQHPARNVFAPVTPQPQQRSTTAAAVPLGSMGRKATAKQCGPASSASAAADKENAALNTNALAQSAPARSSDTAAWTTNVAKWREHDAVASPRSRTPQGQGHARRLAAAPQWHLTPHTRYDRDTARDTSGGAKSPGEQSRSGLRSPQPAEEPDAESPLHNTAPRTAVALDMAPLVALQTTSSSSSTPLLLRSTASTPSSLECGVATSTSQPDVRTEFLALATLSYPVMLTYVLEFLPGIVSMTIVGHLDSPYTKEFVGGVSLSTMFLNLTGMAFGFGLATAMDTLCAQAYGAGKPHKLGIYLQSGLLVLGAAVIPVFLLNWYTEAFLLWMGQPPLVAAFAGRFSRLTLPGIPFLYVYELVKKLLQAQNVVRPMVAIAVLSNVLNLVLGVYLAFYTTWGFDGAAIARTVANVALPLALVPLFAAQPEALRQWWPGWRFAQALQHVRTFLTLGIPGMFMMLLEWWSFEIMAAFVGLLPHSVVAISVHSVLVGVSTMTFNVFLGIAVATNVRVGTFVGQNRPAHAQLAANLGMALALGASAVLAVAVVAARHVLPLVFINDATASKLAAHALLFLIPYQLLDAINSVMQGVFRGTGRNGLGATINLFAYFALGLPLGLYLAFPLGLGVEGLWLGLTAGIFVGCVVSVVKIYGTDWAAMADAARIRTS